MIKALVLKQVASMALAVVTSTVMPHILQDRPVIQWTWDRWGPVVLDAADQTIDSKIDELVK